MNGSATHGDRQAVVIDELEVAAYKIPTEKPESDGTHEWDSTTLVAEHATAAGEVGLGYTNAPSAAALIVKEKLS